MDKEIEKACKSVAALPQTASGHPWQCPAAPWDRIHFDFDKQHFLVAVDAYSKKPEV